MNKCIHFVTVLLLCGMAYAGDTPIRELAAIVRVHNTESVGAGVIVAAAKTGGMWRTDILTVCHAVIDNEGLPFVTRVEYATYIVRPTWFRFKATIAATDEDHDLALLSVLSNFALADPVEVVTEDEIGRMRKLDTIWALGTPGGHRPCATMGNIQGFQDAAPLGTFWFGSAPVAPGNSGGGIFWRGDWGKWKLAGIVSFMDSMVGRRGELLPVTHLSYFVSPFAVREFLKEHGHAHLCR